ncbi:MAG: hypothetical protein FWE24_10195 [Defluviitaleaceae bacterium]|nr:hypothetical protein [Defluviitaleaceae bacterium]
MWGVFSQSIPTKVIFFAEGLDKMQMAQTMFIRAKSQEPRAKSQEPRAKSQERITPSFSQAQKLNITQAITGGC